MTEKTILVIDTDTETSQNIKTILESEGYAVYNSSGMTESISTALKIKPSLVFINIAMRDTSGLEIAKGIHESEPLRDVPIIIITPHGGTVEPRYTLMYGIVDFIKKSFSPEELISKTIDVTEMNSSDSSAVEIQVDQPQEQEPAIKELQEEDIQFTQTNGAQPAEGETFSEVLAEIAPESGKGNAGDRPDRENPQKDIENPESVVDQNITAEKKQTDIYSEEPAIPSSEEDFPDTSSEAGRKPKLATFVLAIVLVIVAVGGGAYLYTSLSGKPETTRPAVSIPPSPSREESPKTEHPPQQVLEQLPEKSSPAAVGQTTEKILPSEAKKVQKKEEESKPTSVKSPPAKEENGPFYSVQVGVFKNKGNALVLVRHFTNLNYHAFFYETSERNKGRLYRVLIGRFDKKKEAEAMANDVRSKENTAAMVFAAPDKKK